MIQVTFIYRDAYTNGEWNEQKCIVETLQYCIDLYGLGTDCEYTIIKIEKVEM